jgi:hypothetical protein
VSEVLDPFKVLDLIFMGQEFPRGIKNLRYFDVVREAYKSYALQSIHLMEGRQLRERIFM